MVSDGGLRKLFRVHLPGIHWSTIETGAAEPGVPDMHGCYNSVAFWLENKLTENWTVGLRVEQIGWMLRYTRAGGRSFIAVRRHCTAGKRRAAADQLYLFSGETALLLNNHGLKAVEPLHLSEGGPTAWNWGAVRKTLVNQTKRRTDLAN